MFVDLEGPSHGQGSLWRRLTAARTRTKIIVLAAVLCAGTALGEGSPPQTSQNARLSRQQAIQLAFAGLKTSGLTATKYKVNTARYQSDKHRWLVKFSEMGPTVQFDSDVTALVDDKTGLVCVKQGTAVGRCT